MVRVLAWDGAQWRDARIWDGSQWRSYSPPVYGANAFREDFSNGNYPGWWGDGYSGRTLQNWNDYHCYVDGDSTVYSSLDMTISRDNSTTPVFASFQAAPGTTIRAQASVLIQHIAGSALPGNGKLDLSATVTVPELSLYASYLTSGQILTGTAGWGWGTPTTNEYSLPARMSNKPYTVEISGFSVNYWPETGAVGPYGTFRMFLDWARLIDQNGNDLLKLTTSAVEPLRVWNGTAWV
jgi:hypothetical protein